MRRSVGLVLLALIIAGCAAPDPAGRALDEPASAGASDPRAFETPGALARAAREGEVRRGGLDAVVVAVLDSRVNPYHMEWRASELPQHSDSEPSNDVPLELPPHEWLSGFPPLDSFASYEPLALTLPQDSEAATGDLLSHDEPDVPGSANDAVHYRFVPGTKIIGVVDFQGSGEVFDASSAHGARTSSVSVGSRFGSCPECLLVFVQIDGTEDPIAWALSQPWIDVVTNSYGYSATSTGTPADRHFVYDGCDLGLQREASERGQALFWSGSNGLVPGRVPGTTYQSCQFGPDWTITVGGVEEDDADAYWSGKPVDVAAPAVGYPSQGGATIGGNGTIGGTSAATPIVAGMYARGLWLARAAMAAASRAQAEGVIATGAVACEAARADCELGDGELTAVEMRRRLLHAALRTSPGLSTPLVPGALPRSPEAELASEGHGSFLARRDGDAGWIAETERIVGPLFGRTLAVEREPYERDWFAVDSYCRQARWGTWTGGYYVEGKTALPSPDPVWPMRTALRMGCSPGQD